MAEETFEFGPSQMINIGWFALVPISAVAFIPSVAITLPIAIYKYLEVAMWRYIIYEDRIVEKKGIFDVKYEEMRYFRIKSIMSVEPFWMRLFGLGVVNILSSEEFKNSFTLHGIENRDDIVSFLHTVTREWREKMGVKEYDLHNL